MAGLVYGEKERCDGVVRGCGMARAHLSKELGPDRRLIVTLKWHSQCSDNTIALQFRTDLKGK